MTEESYYRGAVFGPPIVLTFLAAVGGAIQGVILMAIAYGGIPYLVWAGIMLRWMNDRPLKRVRRAVLLAPVGYLTVFMAQLYLMAILFSDSGPWGSDIAVANRSLGFFASWVFAFGYAWVLLVLVGWRIIARINRSKSLSEVP